jgi:uncharacterized glyoxalase superfamily protein PhnB
LRPRCPALSELTEQLLWVGPDHDALNGFCDLGDVHTAVLGFPSSDLERIRRQARDAEGRDSRHRPGGRRWSRPYPRDVELGRFRLGLRVADVAEAARFYRGLGFEDVASVPGPDRNPVMIMLQRDGAMLIVDALEGMPFAPTEREERVKAGPRGLGVSIGLGVDDLDAAYTWCIESSCDITSEPRVEAYGDLVFECIDPYGYLWEISQPISEVTDDDPVQAIRDEWFGPAH